MVELYIRIKIVGRLFTLCGGKFFNLCCDKFVEGNLGLYKPNLI